MSTDSSDVSRRSRPVLGDLTNQARKGVFSMISCSPTKLGKRNADALTCKENNQLPVKRAALGVENLPVVGCNIIEKENKCLSIPVRSESGQGIRVSSVVKENGSSAREISRAKAEGLSLVDKGQDYASADGVSSGVGKVGEGIPIVANTAKRVTEAGLFPLKGGKVYKLQFHGNSGSCSQDAGIGIAMTNHKIEKQSVVELDCTQENVPQPFTEGGKYVMPKVKCISKLPLSEGVGNEPGEKYVDDEGRERLETARRGSSKESSAVGPQSTKSEYHRSFELTRCLTLKDEGWYSVNAGPKFLNGCSCSFCMKAGFIWSDLHLQDVKGRVSASIKSRREASNLARKVGQFTKFMNSESDLLNQWKSLFVSMEDIFLKESRQLDSSFFSLKEVSENCKKNLEATHGVLVEVQTCSDASTDLMNTR